MLRKAIPNGISSSRAARSQILISKPLYFKSSLYTSSRANTSFFGPVVIKPIPIPIPVPRPFPSLQVRNYVTKPPTSTTPEVDKEAVKARKSVEVSADSTVRHVFTDIGETGGKPAPDVHMGNALAGDLRSIQETFALKSVPRDAYYLGLAGTVPYLGTSLATLYCAWDLNYAASHGNGLLFSSEFADSMLIWLENMQIGYGAVILSFLGAIHWGLEFAGFGNTHSRWRYALGLAAPLVAWPTVMFTYEYALGAQFAGFVMMYWADSKLAANGLAPYWYGTYRFVLTLVVGVSIIISLIGRGEVEVAKEHGGDRTSKRELLKDRGAEGRALRIKYENEKARIYDEKKKEEDAKKAAEEEQKKKEEEENKDKEEEDNKDKDGEEKKDEDDGDKKEDDKK